MNRFKDSSSLYLRQHADNPIHWFEWSEEAFTKALQENKPIFLSIGYSACHFCHKMNAEAYSEEAIAHKINQNYIPILVDRDEHVEIDLLYLQMAQAIMNQTLGYPLHLFLTPNKEPFFAFSYLPAFPNEFYDGCLSQLLDEIHTLWNSEGRKEIDAKGKEIFHAFEKLDLKEPFKIHPGNALAKKAFQEVMLSADSHEGGLLPPPKFPSVPVFRFLLKAGRFIHKTFGVEHVFLTLRKMRRGALWDHVEQGFFRYCVDEKWSIPHFEKMAEDQALLALLAIEAWQYRNESDFSEIAIDTLHFSMKHFSAEDGGMYISMDSDSAGLEGAYYTYTKQEIESLSQLQAARIEELFLSDTSQLGNRYILRQKQSLQDYARQKSETTEELKPKIREALDELKNLRSKRQKPKVDTRKFSYITSLFGFVFLKAYVCFDDQRYLAKAQSNFDYVSKELFHHGELLHANNSTKRADLADYAWAIYFSAMYASTLADREALDFALLLAKQVRKYFSATTGGFYFTDVRDQSIPIRKREYFDMANTSALAILCQGFQILGALTGKEMFFEEVRLTLKAAGPYIESAIPFFGFIESGLIHNTLTTVTAPKEMKSQVLHELSKHFLPDVIFVPEEFALESMAPDMAKYVKDKIIICKKGTCLPPIQEVSQIVKSIEGI